MVRIPKLASFFGVRPAPERPTERLIPDTAINFDRLHAMDMEVEFRAERVEAARVPAQRVEYSLRLDGGRLSFSPLQFDVAEGSIGGEIHLDSNRDPAHLAANLRARGLRLERFLPKLEAAGVAYGTFDGRLRLEGSGEDIRQIMANSDGGVWLSMSGGAVDGLMIAAAGVDIPEFLQLLGEEKTPVPLRCSVAAFDVKDALMESNVVVIDAQESTLFGEGTIDLRNEGLDLRLDAQPKEPSPLVLGGAIEIEGTLRRPTFGLDLSGAARQLGAAAALSAILAPLAAVLPFIDPGTGEDPECGDLFAEARGSVQKSEEEQ